HRPSAGEASLNLFAALVGASSDGKGAADRTAKAAIDVSSGIPFAEAGVGSGEGLGHLFVHRVKGELEQHTQSALMLVPEVGTPQRFLWLPNLDPFAPEATPADPTPIVWQMPRNWGTAVGGLVRLPVCDEAVDTIRAARLVRLRGEGDALDGHSLLCRLKVAA